MNWNPTIRGHKVFGSNLFTGCLVVAFIFAVIGAMVGIARSLPAEEGPYVRSCREVWQFSGYAWRSENQRCYVQTPDGRWLTEVNFRAWLAGRKEAP